MSLWYDEVNRIKGMDTNANVAGEKEDGVDVSIIDGKRSPASWGGGSAGLLGCLDAWMLECLGAWMLECLDAWMLGCFRGDAGVMPE